MPRKTQRRCTRRAAMVVETAMVLAAFLLILFGIFEYCRFLWVRQVCDNAAREGARFAVVHTGDKTEAQVRAEVVRRLAGVESQFTSFNSATDVVIYAAAADGSNIGTWDSAAFGQPVAVRVNGTYKPILPGLLFLSNGIPIQGHSQMASEAN